MPRVEDIVFTLARLRKAADSAVFAQIFDNYVFDGLIDNAATRVTLDTLLSTLVVLFTGEFLPKTIFKSNANSMLTFFAIPAFLCYVLLYPISRFAALLSKGLLRLVGVKMDKVVEDKEFTKVDLDFLVQTSIDNAKSEDDIEEEVRIFQNALDFSDTKVRDCMVPRTEIDAVEDTCDIEQLKQKFKKLKELEEHKESMLYQFQLLK